MQNTNNQQNKRIELVDALRGFALLGILLLHSIEHFDFYWSAEKNPQIFRPIDPYVNNITRFLFSGKVYSIFSLMFGFSFFIQMDRNKNKGIDFRWRFLWRLTLLLLIGYIFSLIYIGEILSIYALLGMPLVLLFRFNKKTLLWLAIILVLQIPTFYNLVHSYTNPDFELQRNFGRGLWGAAFNTFANGTLKDVVKFNLWKGHMAVWSWTYYNGRYLQLFGLFVFGLFLGKTGYFENIEQYKKLTLKVLIVSILSFGILYPLFLKLSDFGLPRVQLDLYFTLIKSFLDLAFTSILVTSFILIYLILKNKSRFDALAAYGRMSLTSYVLQSLIGVPLFYGFGFALYRYFGATLSFMYGILFLIFQLYFCKIWLKHFHYGPLEWVWRALTYINFKLKLKKMNK